MKIPKTEFLAINNDWKAVKNVCRATMNKEPTDYEATEEFKIKMLIAEHSPIRLITFRWIWRGIQSWVCTHFVRHFLGWIPFVSTQRSDRTGVDRKKLPQDNPISLTVDANAQACINVQRKRLCYQCSEDTRLQAEELKRSLTDIDKPVGDVLVPNCIYRAGCPELEMCPQKHWAVFLRYCKERELPINTIRARYDAYNQFFEEGIMYKEDVENVYGE